MSAIGHFGKGQRLYNTKGMKLSLAGTEMVISNLICCS